GIDFRGGVLGAGARKFLGQFGAALLEHLGGAIENLPAQIRGRLGPADLRLARGDHRLAEILARRDAVVAEARAIRAEGWNDAATFPAGKFSTNGELVGFENFEARHGVSI